MFYFFVGLIFVNLFLYYNNYLFLAFLFIDIFYLAKKNDIKLFFLCILGILLFYTFNINYYNFHTEDKYFKGQVTVEEKYDSYSIAKCGNGKYLIYNNDYEFNRDSILYLEGNIESITNSYNSFYVYLNKKGVNYEINYKSIAVLENNKPYNEEIVDKLLNGKSEENRGYLKLILFNEKDEGNKSFYNTFYIYSLTYLIAVSGFHIRILLKFLKKIFKNSLVGYLFVAFYLYLLNFSVSSYRAYLCSLLKKINKKLGFKLSNNDILSLIGSVFLIADTSVMFSYGFIYSFLATFVLEIFRLYTKNGFLMSFYIYIINIPIMLLNSYKLNMFTLIFSVLLSPVISFIYVFSFIYLFLDKFYLLYEIVISLFLSFFSIFEQFDVSLVFGSPSVVFVIVYYLLLLIYFVSKECGSKRRYFYMVSVFILLFYQYNKPILNSHEQFYFINVGQGDCTAFIIPNSKEVVLVDTGGSIYSDVAEKEVIPFLESKGVNKIRKIIITHDDFDHNGALQSLKNNFVVEEVISSSNIVNVGVGNSVFTNLNVNNRRDNDGSIVLLGEYGGYNLLLMGDAPVEVEEKIMNNIENVDIVKIGHHGSSTSSSHEFLDKINGKVAIISVGKNNMYGHPNKRVLDDLNKLGYLILRTDENDDIGFGKNIYGISFVEYFK